MPNAASPKIVRTFKLSRLVPLPELLEQYPDLPLDSEDSFWDYIYDEVWGDFEHAIFILQHHLELMENFEERFYENYVQRIETPPNFQWPIDPTDPASESIKLYECLIVEGDYFDKKSANQSCKVLLERFPDIVSIVGPEGD